MFFVGVFFLIIICITAIFAIGLCFENSCTPQEDDF
jgi:hypothetical protein